LYHFANFGREQWFELSNCNFGDANIFSCYYLIYISITFVYLIKYVAHITKLVLSLLHPSVHWLDGIVVSSLDQHSVFMTYMLGTCWVRAPELVDLFFGITTRLILHRDFAKKTGLGFRSELIWNSERTEQELMEEAKEFETGIFE
jgi:hypothetical protein